MEKMFSSMMAGFMKNMSEDDKKRMMACGEKMAAMCSCINWKDISEEQKKAVMRKMMSRQGAGSLCAEMMKKIMERENNGCSFDCAEMLRKMMKECSKVQEEPEKSKEEVSHGREES